MRTPLTGIAKSPQEPVRSLSDQTLIPIGLAIMAIGGGAAWLTSIHIETRANADMIREIKTAQDRYMEDIHAIRINITEINTQMKIMSELKKKR